MKQVTRLAAAVTAACLSLAASSAFAATEAEKRAVLGLPPLAEG